MAPTFSVIPASVLQPLFYAETSAAAANGIASTAVPTVLLGQKLPSGTATANAKVLCSSWAQAETYCAAGSQLARMAYPYFATDPLAQVYLLPLADNGSTKAATTITFTGAATADGTVSLYVGGQLASVAVTALDSVTTIAAKFKTDVFGVDEAAAVVLGSRFPVTANNSSGALTLTARNAGTLGNSIDVRVNYLGLAGGESLPAGIAITELAAVTHVQLTGGSTDPSLTSAITAIGDFACHVVHSYTGSTELTALRTDFGDTAAGRWGPILRRYGHHFSASVEPYATIAGLSTKNDPHCSIFGIEASPTPPWECAGNFAGVALSSLRANPSLHLNTLALDYIKAPAAADQFVYSEREALLGLGITTPMIGSDGTVRIQRAVTTYRTNPAGAADAAYRDIATPFNLAYQLTAMESAITTKYGRVNIVDDTTNIGPGVAAVTPSMIRRTLINLYRSWEALGYVENAETFAALLVVQRDSTDPTRVNVLYPPDIANGLHVFAVLNQFRLAYSADDLAA
jgi:phage tail sheath gpL-like